MKLRIGSFGDEDLIIIINLYQCEPTVLIRYTNITASMFSINLTYGIIQNSLILTRKITLLKTRNLYLVTTAGPWHYVDS